MDSGAEHIRETRAKILAAKKEIKEYLRLPEDARGLLILTHGKGCPASPEKEDPSTRELLRRADSTGPVSPICT